MKVCVLQTVNVNTRRETYRYTNIKRERGTWQLELRGTLALHFWSFVIFLWMFYSFKKLINNLKVLPTHAGHSFLECPAPCIQTYQWAPKPHHTQASCPEDGVPGWAWATLGRRQQSLGSQTGCRPKTGLQSSLPETLWRAGQETNSSGWHFPNSGFSSVPGLEVECLGGPEQRGPPFSLHLISIACPFFQKR